jgi:hypothetical protein
LNTLTKFSQVMVSADDFLTYRGDAFVGGHGYRPGATGFNEIGASPGSGCPHQLAHALPLLGRHRRHRPALDAVHYVIDGAR